MPPLVVTGVGSLGCDFPSAAQGSLEPKACPRPHSHPVSVHYGFSDTEYVCFPGQLMSTHLHSEFGKCVIPLRESHTVLLLPLRTEFRGSI